MASSRSDSKMLILVWGVVMIAIAIPYTTFFQALVGWQFWQWFLIPIGAPDISGWHIAGLFLLLSFTRVGLATKKTETDKTIIETTITVFVQPIGSAALYLLVGWIIAKFAGLA